MSQRRIVVFVFVSGRFLQTECYSYLYSVIFEKPNSIRIRIRSPKQYSLTSDYDFINGV